MPPIVSLPASAAHRLAVDRADAIGAVDQAAGRLFDDGVRPRQQSVEAIVALGVGAGFGERVRRPHRATARPRPPAAAAGRRACSSRRPGRSNERCRGSTPAETRQSCNRCLHRPTTTRLRRCDRRAGPPGPRSVRRPCRRGHGRRPSRRAASRPPHTRPHAERQIGRSPEHRSSPRRLGGRPRPAGGPGRWPVPPRPFPGARRYRGRGTRSRTAGPAGTRRSRSRSPAGRTTA